MNIFFLHTNPAMAALFMCDKHVIKMILESLQLLWCAHYFDDSTKIFTTAEKNNIQPYRKSHYNHPCAVWVRQDLSHYMWLVEHVAALHEIYYDHFGNKKHKSYPHINFLKKHPPNIPHLLFQQPPQAMPEPRKTTLSVNAYRSYYLNEKSYFLDYRCTRPLPEFIPINYIHLTHQKKIKKICVNCVCEY